MAAPAPLCTQTHVTLFMASICVLLLFLGNYELSAQSRHTAALSSLSSLTWNCTAEHQQTHVLRSEVNRLEALVQSNVLRGNVKAFDALEPEHQTVALKTAQAAKAVTKAKAYCDACKSGETTRDGGGGDMCRLLPAINTLVRSTGAAIASLGAKVCAAAAVPGCLARLARIAVGLGLSRLSCFARSVLVLWLLPAINTLVRSTVPNYSGRTIGTTPLQI